MSRITAVLVVIVFLSLGTHDSLAQWPLYGRALTNAAGTQRFPAIAPDGTGGAIVTWQDRRTGNNDDVYAQRVSATGVVKWTADGLSVCNAITDQQNPAITADGNRGAFLVWSDFRDNVQFDLFAQHLDSLGTALWGANGKSLGAFGNAQVDPLIVSDGAGGAIYACQDWRAGNADVYAQRVDATGTRLWVSGFGVGVCTASGTQSLIRMIPDGLGGAILTWQDFRAVSQIDIFAQRVNASGTVQWTLNGNQVVNDPQDQSSPVLCSDGAGGAIIAWQDFRNSHYNIYAQRYDVSGVTQWTLNGVVVCGAASGQVTPTIVSDGAGGAIIAWQDNRGPNFPEIFAQRINATGTALWAADGIPVCEAPNLQQSPVIVPDGSGGAIVAWRDFRNPNTSLDVFAQRINSSGVPQWTTNGIPLCTAATSQNDLVATADGFGGVVTAWTDLRNGPSDIYAMRARAIPTSVNGATPLAPMIALRNYPNPFTGSTTLEIELSHGADLSIEVFDVAGRRVTSMLVPDRGAGVYQFAFDGHDDTGRSLASGVYFCRVSAEGTTVTRKMVLVR